MLKIVCTIQCLKTFTKKSTDHTSKTIGLVENEKNSKWITDRTTDEIIVDFDLYLTKFLKNIQNFKELDHQ